MMATTPEGVRERSEDVWSAGDHVDAAVTIVAAWMSAETGVGPSNGVGEPDVEGNLRGLAGASYDEKKSDGVRSRLPPSVLLVVEKTVEKSSEPEVANEEEHRKEGSRSHADAVER